jgi:small subunit ribosomal protein S4
MGNYNGPDCRRCRREGQKLFLKGARCMGPKCPIDSEKHNKPPGDHGGSRRPRKQSDYGMQLREKQKCRRVYGIRERQFRNYFRSAVRRRGVTGEELLRQLERRLDNVVYRLGFASSRDEAKQLVSHRHFTVNGKIVNVSSYQVREGDTVAVKARSRAIQPIQIAVNSAGSRSQPEWLEANFTDMTGRIVGLPTRDQIDTEVNEQLIVEFYSR